MRDRNDAPAARGDEAELFRSFNESLLRSVGRAVRVSTPEVVEDACAYAWAAFLEHQPDRNRNWQGWLFRSAQREAWKLERVLRATDALEPVAVDEIELDEAVSSLDELEFRNDVHDALSLIAALPLRLRRIALLRALGFTHAEIGAVTGDSKARVHVLAGRANRQIAEFLEQRNRSASESPRAERLWQLEQDPPDWLIAKLGPPIRACSRIPGQSVTRLAWRRAAIALDDYRRAAGVEAVAALRSRPVRDGSLRGVHGRALRALRAFEFERGNQRER